VADTHDRDIGSGANRDFSHEQPFAPPTRIVSGIRFYGSTDYEATIVLDDEHALLP
jgi:hypothetical protein